MRATPRRGQLALEWRGAVHWNELPMAARAELRALLRELLWRAAHGDAQAEGAPDE